MKRKHTAPPVVGGAHSYVNNFIHNDFPSSPIGTNNIFPTLHQQEAAMMSRHRFSLNLGSMPGGGNNTAAQGKISSSSKISPTPSFSRMGNNNHTAASLSSSSSGVNSSEKKSSGRRKTLNSGRPALHSRARKRRYSLRTRQLVKGVEGKESASVAAEHDYAQSSLSLFGHSHHHHHHRSSIASNSSGTPSSPSSISSTSNFRLHSREYSNSSSPNVITSSSHTTSSATPNRHRYSFSTHRTDGIHDMLGYDSRKSSFRRRRKTGRKWNPVRLLKWPSYVVSAIAHCSLKRHADDTLKHTQQQHSQTSTKRPSTPNSPHYESTTTGTASICSSLCGVCFCLDDVYSDDEDPSMLSTTTSHNCNTTSRSHGHVSSAATPACYSSADHLDDECTHASSLASDSSRCLSTRRGGNTKDTFKVIILGSRGVGKTATISAFENPLEFKEHYTPTDSIQFSTIDCQNGLMLQLYDSSSEEDDEERIAVFYDDVDAVIFIYDVMDRASFQQIESVWHKELSQYADNFGNSAADGSGPLKILVGNKVDLRDQDDDLQTMIIRNDETVGHRKMTEADLRQSLSSDTNKHSSGPQSEVEDDHHVTQSERSFLDELNNQKEAEFTAPDLASESEHDLDDFAAVDSSEDPSMSSTAVPEVVSANDLSATELNEIQFSLQEQPPRPIFESSPQTPPHLRNYVTYKDGAQLADRLDCVFFESSMRTKQNSSILLNTLSSRFRSLQQQPVVCSACNTVREEDAISMYSDH